MVSDEKRINLKAKEHTKKKKMSRGCTCMGYSVFTDSIRCENCKMHEMEELRVWRQLQEQSDRNKDRTRTKACV